MQKQAERTGNPQVKLSVIYDLAEKLVKEGNSEGYKLLGDMYRDGEGKPQSYEEAIKYYSKASSMGSIDAVYNMVKGKIVKDQSPHSAPCFLCEIGSLDF